LDLVLLETKNFPVYVRLIGLTGVIFIHFLLKRTGKLLRLLGECELWGWSTKLIVNNVYKYVRHPHHLGIGIFMTFLGLLIGYPVTFIVITTTQWLWVFLFVILIEEKECLGKFGDEYREYQRNVPMFFGNPIKIIKELLTPL
jgi:protein-S-isoprenylcysteine O-methyltransferase Ste14